MAEKDGEQSADFNDSISGEFPSDKGDGTSDSATGGEEDVQSKKQRFQTPSPKPGVTPFMVQASPPKFVSFDDLMAAANGVRNMSLAHEIAVDTNFKLEKLDSQPTGMEKQVKEIMHKAFWDVFQEKVSEDPPDFGHALLLIQENLLSLLLPQHLRLRDQITEVLDMDLIQQKLENEAFDIYYYSDYVLSIMGKLCAPARDERIRNLRQMKDVVPLFNDCVHELLGHVPMFADPLFAQFSQNLGLATLGASDSDIEKFATMHWFTVEFGLCRQRGELRAYGAGILSSYGELEHALSDAPEKRPFDPVKTAVHEYTDEDLQPLYFIAESFEDMMIKMKAYAASIRKPYEVRYDPFTHSVIVLNSKAAVDALAESVSTDADQLQRAVSALVLD